MQNSVVTQKEGVDLLCKKIIEKLEPGGFKKACIRVLELAGQDGKRVLLATKGISSEKAMRDPNVRKVIRLMAFETKLPYSEALNSLRAFINN